MVREFKDLDSCVLIGPRGLSVKEVHGLRSRLREKAVKMRVVKNSLAKLALEQTELKGVSALLDGPSAVLYGGEGAIAISKLVVAEVRKAKNKILIHGGYSEGEILDAEGILVLSTTPSREEALSMVMSNFFGPVSDLSGAMNGLLQEVQGLIEALETKRTEGGE